MMVGYAASYPRPDRPHPGGGLPETKEAGT